MKILLRKGTSQNLRVRIFWRHLTFFVIYVLFLMHFMDDLFAEDHILKIYDSKWFILFSDSMNIVLFLLRIGEPYVL